MRLLRVLRQRIRSLFRGAKLDAELERELAYHLEQLTQENIAAGMEPGEARLAARRALGGAAQIAEQCRDHRRIGWVTDLARDVAYAWRMLRKSPGFTALAIVTLAVGLGASIAVYAICEGLLVRALPFRSPERLVEIWSVHERRGKSGVGQADFRDWQASNAVFERMAFTEFSQMTLTGWGDAERVQGRAVSEEFFEMLGVAPLLGRWFEPRDRNVVMLSHRLWLRKMGARADVVGASIILNGRTYRIAGVMPPDFRFNEQGITEYWIPIGYRSYGHMQHQYSGYARLKRGVTVQSAQAQMSEIARRMQEAYPENAGWGVQVKRLTALPEDSSLLVLAATALIVLLVGCANVAGLLLARGVGRSKEIAVRMAMGAGRARVVRLLLTESMLLASLGALAGLVLAYWLITLAVAAAPRWLDLGAIIAVSPSMAAFSILLTLATGALTGLWPALKTSRTHLQDHLKESGAALVAGRQHTRALNSLVVIEIALAVVLLSFAGLLAKSFIGMVRTNLGYRTDHVLTFRMPLPAARYPNDQGNQRFVDALLPQLAALAGVVSVAASDSIPLGGTYSGTTVEIEGQPARTDWKDWADVMTRGGCVTPDYFRTLGIASRAGRTFNAGDTAGAEPVAIVNEEFVRKLMPGRSALGSRLRLSDGTWRRIVGVIRDIRYSGPLVTIGPEFYVPFAQQPYLQFVSLRTAVPEQTVLSGVRRVVRGLDPALAMSQVRTMRQAVDSYTVMPRTMTTIVTAFALIVLGMASLGLGGVMAYTVSRRRREIGLRVALGARRGDVARAVFRGAAWLIAGGSVMGAAVAFAGGRVMASLLYGVRPHDPAVLVAAPAVLAVIALLACIAPARRAAAVEPMAALRQE